MKAHAKARSLQKRPATDKHGWVPRRVATSAEFSRGLTWRGEAQPRKRPYTEGTEVPQRPQRKARLVLVQPAFSVTSVHSVISVYSFSLPKWSRAAEKSGHSRADLNLETATDCEVCGVPLFPAFAAEMRGLAFLLRDFA
jgi:hypothetical protein